jgi:hypothetical protein
MSLDRREFLSLGGKLLLTKEIAVFLGGALGASLPLNALAFDTGPVLDANDRHMFLNIRAWGGMDVVLGLNPWTKATPDPLDLYLDDGYSVRQRVGGTQIALGPSAFALERHARSLAVLNGVFMGATDLGHPSAQNYVTTAKGSPNVPHFTAELAEFFRKRKQDKSETVLFNAEMKTFDFNELTRLPLQRLAQLAAEKTAANASSSLKPPPISTGETSVGRSQEKLRAAGGEQKIFFAKLKEAREISAKHGGTVEGADVDLVAIAAFASDRARFAQVDWSYLGLLDTHEDYPQQHQKNQKTAWDRCAHVLDVMSELKHHATGRPLFPDHVTLCLVSEFGRTPFLNPARGKDHDFFDNSVLLGGRGIQGGRVVGANHLFIRDEKRRQSQLSGVHIDYKTGQLVMNDYYKMESIESGFHETADVRLIRPENVLRTLADVFSVDPGSMRLFSKDTPPVPGIKA